MPGCSEHFIVNNLINHQDYIPEISFILEKDGEIIGCIFYSHSKVIDSDGSECKTITFGPVCIKPELHRMGYGRELISYSIEIAKKIGYGAIIIGGFPYHYETYGFVESKKYNVAMADGNYYTGIMVLPLKEGYLDSIKNGILYFSDAYDFNEVELGVFDEKFPTLKKEVLPCQKDFEAAALNIDTNSY